MSIWAKVKGEGMIGWILGALIGVLQVCCLVLQMM